VYIVWLFDTNQAVLNSWTGGWFRGVSSLYASEIAINHEIVGNESLRLRTYHNDPNYMLMDARSTLQSDINENVAIIHIHVWQLQNPKIFSKAKWHQTEHNEYFANLSHALAAQNWTSDTLQIREYCLAIAYDLHYNLSVTLFELD